MKISPNGFSVSLAGRFHSAHCCSHAIHASIYRDFAAKLTEAFLFFYLSEIPPSHYFLTNLLLRFLCFDPIRDG
jgi:hypothetical protein